MKHLLVPIDGSEPSYKAFQLALDLAEHHGAEITLLHVTPTRDIPPALKRFAEVEHMENGGEWLYDKALGERMLAAAREKAAGRMPDKLHVSVHSGEPATGPETLVPDRSASEPSIVVGLDGSPGSNAALAWAVPQTGRFGPITPVATWLLPWWASGVGAPGVYAPPPTEELQALRLRRVPDRLGAIVDGVTVDEEAADLRRGPRL